MPQNPTPSSGELPVTPSVIANGEKLVTPDTVASEARAEKTAYCRMCLAPIDPEAKRCNACHSYQGWRRLFDSSALILSLLIALISVISTAAPQIREWLSPHVSRLHVQSAYYSLDGITLIVENQGMKPGHIGIVNVVMYSVDPSVPWSKWSLNLDLATPHSTKRTIPGKSSSEPSFIFSPQTIQRMEIGYPDGQFWNHLYQESIRIAITAELWDYGASKPRYVDVTPRSHWGLNHEAADSAEQPFWQGFITITQRQGPLESKQ